MSPFDHLFTLWRDPRDGTRHVVGDLWREAEGYRFRYARDLALATTRGFTELSEFPRGSDDSAEFSARYLFPTFAQRIPDPRRRDRHALLDAWGVENVDDPMEILARSGGVQLTDRVELAEHRDDDDDLSRPLEFRVSGARFQPHADELTVAVGDPIALRRDRDNEHDGSATLVLVRDGARLGFVPRQYSAMVARLLDASAPLAGRIVRKLVLPQETGRWVVRLERDALGSTQARP